MHTTQVTLSPIFVFLIDSSALIPHMIIYFKKKFISVKTLIWLLPILHFIENMKSSTKPCCLLTCLVHFHVLFHSPSSTMTLSLPLNSSSVFFFFYLFVSLPKLLPLKPNFKMVEIQVGYADEKEGISWIYLKLKKNSKRLRISTGQNRFAFSCNLFQMGISKLSCWFVADGSL